MRVLGKKNHQDLIGTKTDCLNFPRRCVIQPYQEFPSLLELLLSFLKTEQLVSIRRETLRVLGLLGALDPYKHKMNLGHIDSQVNNLRKTLTLIRV